MVHAWLAVASEKTEEVGNMKYRKCNFKRLNFS